MGYQLNNGDQLQVFTSKNQKPREDWLKLVVTGKARSKIRHSIKEEKRDQSEYGKESLMRKLDHMKVNFEKGADALVKFFGYRGHLDLYYDISIDKINLTETLRHFKVEDHGLVEKDTRVKTKSVEGVPRKNRRVAGKASKLLIEGQSAEQYSYHLASCCNPVQGDDVFAFLTSGAGVKIHRANCPNATHLMANYGYRILNAEWAESEGTQFVVDLLITGIDDGPGVINKLASAISEELDLDIRSFSISGDAGYFEGKMSLVVPNKDRLNIVIRNLKKLDNVSVVKRIS